ncbi:MAG: protein-glutamate O-methyltransferase CheR [Clostridiales bacterium]
MLELTNTEFTKLITFIKSNYGINLSQKRTLVNGRLSTTLTETNFKNFSEYFDFILNDKSGNLVRDLINKLTTNHTFFLRETSHFEYYKNTILPIFYNNIPNNDLRVWSAGCSTGEEPYTLSMINNDFFANDKYKWDTKILATDISTRVLNIAKSATYAKDQINNLYPNWKINYFKKLDSNNYQLVDKIKNDVIIRHFNLNINTFPFKKKFHVIFCRNVMIYFDQPTKSILINKFYDFLEHGGYLFIGHSESIKHDETNFRYIMPATYIKD